MIKQLKSVEKPVLYCESLEQVIESSKTCKYISKSNLKKLIIERSNQETQNGG